MPCIMPEMPYCPACEFGRVSYPEWVETYEDTQGAECNWECLCTEDRYEQYLAERENEDAEVH